MNWTTFIYVTRADAIEDGMTHEGRLFGCPAWLRIDSEEQVTGTPKIPALHLWCWLVDFMLGTAACLIPEDVQIVSPISIGKPIA